MGRILDLIRNDFRSLLPGSGVPFSLHSVLKLLLYAGFVLFLVQLFTGWPDRPANPAPPPEIDRPI
jgi:hypothetical protein